MKIIKKYKVVLVKESSTKYNLESKKITSPYEASIILEEVFKMGVQAEEIFVILALDVKNNVIGAFEVSRGSLTSSLVHPREVFKRAILVNAHAIILGHNHPSGETEPSHDDIILTNRLNECGNILGIKVLDHIITGDTYFSFKEENLI